jgi:hypothetical protein
MEGSMSDDRAAADAESFKTIVDGEVLRRRGLYQSALKMMEPIIELLRLAAGQGVEASLELRPPRNRNSSIVVGKMHCRAFHGGVGDDVCDYSVVVAPEDGSCQMIRPNDMSEEEERDYHDDHGEWPDPDWVCTYWATDRKRAPTINDLRTELGEALITDAVERQEGLNPLSIGSGP